MQTYARFLGVVFGVMMVVLSALITLETLLRKLFSFTLGGVDELGGYAIAIAAPLAFTVALVERSHIRINQLASLLRQPVQAVLNALSAFSLLLLAGYFLYFTLDTVLETEAYNSIAQTPWATPLIYPQLLWLAAMLTFPVGALILAANAASLLLRRDWTGLLAGFGPVSAQAELEAELDDLKKREEHVR